MPNNYLITGQPGSGKTTVVEKIVSNLEDEGFNVGGIYCPEIRSKGKRKGFKIIDVETGESKILAHVDFDRGPKISKYHVNVENVDEISENAISRALKNDDLIVIDEIAPMETHSSVFRTQVTKAMDSEKPLLAVVHKRTSRGFIGRVKERNDSKIYEVTKENRSSLPEKIEELILKALS